MADFTKQIPWSLFIVSRKWHGTEGTSPDKEYSEADLQGGEWDCCGCICGEMGDGSQ